MSYYFDSSNVRAYYEMLLDYNNKFFVNLVKEHCDQSAKLLELGSGPGVDLDELSKDFMIEGSDYSKEFQALYFEISNKNPYINIDAKNFLTDTKYDAIISNKVLIHFDPTQVMASLTSQKNALKSGGLVIHTFWSGEEMEVFNDLPFYYYDKATVRNMFSFLFEVIDVGYYTEENKDDSVYVVAKSRT